MQRLVESVLPVRLGRDFRWLVASSWTTNLGDGITLAAGPLLIVGAGIQARAHLEAFREVLSVKQVFITSRTRENADQDTDGSQRKRKQHRNAKPVRKPRKHVPAPVIRAQHVL